MANILVLDPETRISEVIRKVLVSEEHQVTVLESMDAALPLVDAASIDVVIADASLSSGLWKLARVENGQTLVIITSLLPDKPAILEALRGGACRFLTKPVSIRVLQTAVREALEELQNVEVES